MRKCNAGERDEQQQIKKNRQAHTEKSQSMKEAHQSGNGMH